MASNQYVVFLFVFHLLVDTRAQFDTFSYILGGKFKTTDLLGNLKYELDYKLRNEQEIVDVQLFYECLCPDCRQFYTSQFVDVVKKLNNYLNVRIYPYGNAKTFVDDQGHVTFKCQHGPVECYGNKLHACALDNISNKTEAFQYNSCMMDNSQSNHGSDDIAADRCAVEMNVNSKQIKECAKGDRGTKLLKYYGEESKKINYKYVPYILINDRESDGTNFMGDVCAAFKSSLPPPCQK